MSLQVGYLPDATEEKISSEPDLPGNLSNSKRNGSVILSVPVHFEELLMDRSKAAERHSNIRKRLRSPNSLTRTSFASSAFSVYCFPMNASQMKLDVLAIGAH
jgi:hypothetical protein